MNPRVLFIITSDPRRSGKPAEAIRIAAGVSAWKKTDVTIYFRDAAVLALGEDTTEFINEDNYVRYLPMLSENERPIFAQQGNSALVELGEPMVNFEQLSDVDLAKLAAAQDYVLRF
jgi:sulfur relay (sulfurtransferase) DsrF/TusC family protein